MAQNRKLLFMLLIGLFFGTGLGFLLASPPAPAHDHASHDHAVMHDALTDAGTTAPSLTLHLTPEDGGGMNLHMMTENFRFAPEAVNGPHAPGEGHAHVYIDGTKIARAYGPWVHIASIPDDAQTLTVTLNANNHSTLTTGDQPITASIDLSQFK